MNHFATLTDFSNAELLEILDLADKLKSSNYRSDVARDKVLGLLFFNPSLRTKVSFEVAAAHLGATSSIISPGNGSWTLETRTGAIMNAEKTEHIKEAIQVLSRYCDTLGVRAFASLNDYSADFGEFLLKSIQKYSDVPVINLESAMEHPCQGLADWMTIREIFGKNSLSNKKLVLTWAPHPHPLPQAVPNSVLEIASRSGIQVTLACPPEMSPNQEYISRFQKLCNDNGNTLNIEYNQRKALENADVVYVKSWAAPVIYDSPETEQKLRKQTYSDWTLTSEKMSVTNNARFMHCLPVRRNVVVSDDVIDSPQAVHIDEAENRLHVQKAILMKLWNLSL